MIILKSALTLLIVSMVFDTAKSQNVAINNTGSSASSSAMLDVSSSTKGILIPRMTTALVNSIANPAKGLLVYDSLASQLLVNVGTPAVPQWQTIAANNAWSLTGNAGTTAQNFIGTIDNAGLQFKIKNQRSGYIDSIQGKTSLGYESGYSLNKGWGNTAIGFETISNADSLNENTAIGNQAMEYIKYGDQNTVIGYRALNNIDSSVGNTVIGYNAMGGFFSTNTGFSNVAIGTGAMKDAGYSYNVVAVGDSALFKNGSGSTNSGEGTFNTAVGSKSLFNNSTGSANTALGTRALYNNSTGYQNTAMGASALSNLSQGYNNTAIGAGSMSGTIPGFDNTGVGANSLLQLAQGSANTGIGTEALFNVSNGSNNVALGKGAGFSFNTNNCTYIGFNADATNFWTNATAIGYAAVVNNDNKIRLGNAAVTVIEGQVAYTTSDARFKTNVNENVPGIDLINALKPVTYQYKSFEIDQFLLQNNPKQLKLLNKGDYSKAEQMVHMGLIAQEVEKTLLQKGYSLSIVHKPDNVTDNYSIAYGELVIPLIKSVQQLSQQVEELKKENEAIKEALNKIRGK